MSINEFEWKTSTPPKDGSPFIDVQFSDKSIERYRWIARRGQWVNSNDTAMEFARGISEPKLWRLITSAAL
jgi:hypothetical protein